MSKSNVGLTLSLLFAIFLWGGNNTGTRFIVENWPPIFTGASRFICAGLLLLLLLRHTSRAGERKPISGDIQRRLWLSGGLSLAAYIVSFNWALRFTSVSHVALYLGASPVWALLWEGFPGWSLKTLRRYGAALLALAGLFILFRPALKFEGAIWKGELLGLAAGMLWTNYGRVCRGLITDLSGAEVTCHTMWRAGLLLSPLAALELFKTPLVWTAEVVLVQAYCILAGGVGAFWIWNNALRHWPASQVLLFNNLIPLSTMLWAWACLGEHVRPAFWVAMAMVLTGVLLGQVKAKQG